MAILRTYAQVEASEPTKAELQLIEACKAGEPCTLGDGTCPDTPSPERTIRAEILRYLLLGGCPDCVVDGRGVWLVGGYIEGPVDIDHETVTGATQLSHCHFDSRFDSIQTKFKMVVLNGCTLQGWDAARAKIQADVFLQNTTATATIDLKGVAIGGGLSCIGAKINAPMGVALDAARSKIKGGVFLHPARQNEKNGVQTPFAAEGEVNFTEANIGALYAENVHIDTAGEGIALELTNVTSRGLVRLSGSTINGEVKLAGGRILGDLNVQKACFTCNDGHAFNGQRMCVDQSFIWKKVEHGEGAVSLNGAHVAELDDHPESWPGRDALYLDGFTYNRIRGKVSTSRDRMNWLQNGSFFDGVFRPQPYTQYAKFLRDMGHDADARKVLAARERLLRRDERKRRQNSGEWYAQPVNALSLVWDIGLRGLAGYGHHPFRTVLWLFVLWLIAVGLSHRAWENGDFAPSSAVLQNAPEWRALAAMDKTDLPNPAKEWVERRLADGERIGYTPGQDWETFNRYAYAADLVIPIINLGQTDAWGPSTERGDWGRRLWRYGFFLQFAGWIVTALGAAAITGIIRRD